MSILRTGRVLAVLGYTNTNAEILRVGSKNFNESYILAEIMSQALEGAGYEVERRFGLGGTLICYSALLNDEIDIYPEYTGTLAQAKNAGLFISLAVFRIQWLTRGTLTIIGLLQTIPSIALLALMIPLFGIVAKRYFADITRRDTCRVACPFYRVWF